MKDIIKAINTPENRKILGESIEDARMGAMWSQIFTGRPRSSKAVAIRAVVNAGTKILKASR